MLGLISKIIGSSHSHSDHECNCDMFSTEPSTDEERLDSLHGHEVTVPKINVQETRGRRYGQVTPVNNLENEDDQEDDCKRNGGTQSPSSSTFESTDSNSPREARRKSSKCVSREVLQRVSELVEYYLSDENLVNDMFLLKHITKHKEGFVSLKLLANYKKLKRVKKDWTVLVEALKNSSNLEINEEGTKVRRINKLSCDLEDDTRLFRSVLAYDIPENMATIEKIAELFSKYGDVDSIQMHKPGGKPIAEIKLASYECLGLSESFCCLVVYEKVHCARHALKQLTSNENSSVKVMAIPRTKIPSSTSKLDMYCLGKDHESAYFSASDVDDSVSSFVLHSHHSSHVGRHSRPCSSLDWRSKRSFSPSSSFYSPRSPRSLRHWGAGCNGAGCSSDERTNALVSTATHNLRQLRLASQHNTRGTPTSSPMNPRKRFTHRHSDTQKHSPSVLRRGPPLLSTMAQTMSAPNSPWMRRKQALVRGESHNDSDGPIIIPAPPSASHADFSQPSPREGSVLPENVIRMPRGPIPGEKGFKPRTFSSS